MIVDVERMLFAFRGIDFDLKVPETSNAQFSSKSSRKEEEEEESDDETFVGGSRSTRAKGRGIRSSRKEEEDDDEFDL